MHQSTRTEAFGEHILLLGAVAYRQVVFHAELLVAIIAGALAGLLGVLGAREDARAGTLGRVRLGGTGLGVGRGIVEVDDGTVGEACTLAEGGRGWRRVSTCPSAVRESKR